MRQLVDASGAVTLTKSYEPNGEGLSALGNGRSAYGFTGEWESSVQLLYLRSRYYSLETGRFLTRDIWHGDFTMPPTLNKWVYAGANPITRKDPTGKWYCTGHANCSDWVNKAISKLSASGDTGQKIIKFFIKYDSEIMAAQDATIKWALGMGAEKYDPCFKSRHKAGGLQIEFTDSPFPESLANTFDEKKLQFLKSGYITGSNPTNWGGDYSCS